MGKLVRGFMTTCFLGLLSTCMPLFAGVRPSASRPTNDHKATEPATISNLQIVPGHRDFEIVISQSRPLVPSVIKLSQPSRFVLDFPTFRPALTYTHLEVNRDGVKAIRIGRHDNPLSTRIVFDLVADLNHSLSSSKDGIKVRFSRLAFPTAKSEGPQAADPPQSAEQESARESQSPTSTTVAAQSPAPSGSTTYSENSTAPNAQK